MRWIFTLSGIELRRCWSSWSVVEVGTRRPFLFPAVRRPTMRVPAIVQWQIGITSWSSASKTLWKGGGLVGVFSCECAGWMVSYL